MKRALVVATSMVLLSACQSGFVAKRSCGPLSVVHQAARIDLRINDLRQCRSGRPGPDRLRERLESQLKEGNPGLEFVGEDADDDLLLIFSVSDRFRGCILPSWSWNLALDAWLPAPAAPGGEAFAQVVDIHGTTRVGGDFVLEVVQVFEAIRKGTLSPAIEPIKCVYGLDAHQ